MSSANCLLYWSDSFPSEVRDKTAIDFRDGLYTNGIKPLILFFHVSFFLPQYNILEILARETKVS